MQLRKGNSRHTVKMDGRERWDGGGRQWRGEGGEVWGEGIKYTTVLGVYLDLVIPSDTQ